MRSKCAILACLSQDQGKARMSIARIQYSFAAYRTSKTTALDYPTTTGVQASPQQEYHACASKIFGAAAFPYIRQHVFTV
jgi:hypothetical protein